MKSTKQKTKWSWKWQPKGAPKASVAGEYIEKIKKKRKGITPQLLVIEAKDKKSPLHKCFEWNDTKAADEHRISQARQILRMLVVRIESDDGKPVKYRAFISPQSPDNTSYHTIKEVCEDEDLSESYQEQLKMELIAIKDKIKRFPIFKEVVQAIEKITVY
jgi:hypothetical protein